MSKVISPESQALFPQSIVMPDAFFKATADKIDEIRTSIPGLDPYSEDDVKAMNKISDGDKVYIGDCLVEAPAAKDMLPSYFSIEDVRQNNLSHDQLYILEDKLFELYTDVRRNRMGRADKAYSGVSSFYKFIAAAVDHKVPFAAAMHKRLQDYHMKKVETANANKKKIEAAKKKADEERAAEKAAAEVIASTPPK